MRETPQTEIQYQDKKNEVKNFLDGNYISWKKIGSRRTRERLEQRTREGATEGDREGKGARESGR
jgi:hypothetical protein